MDNLAFQDFQNSPFTQATNPNTDQRHPGAVDDTSNLVTGNIDLNSDSSAKPVNPNANFFSFKFYQQYFDVDQDQVQTRLLRSLIPTVNSNFITDHIQPIPDLYGPLWICITFVFSTAICGNLAHYIETHGQEHYENDFGLVTGATSLIASYMMFIPFFLYWAMWYRKTAIQYSYLELLSAYGYSWAIFVPVSVLWVIHFHWFRWALIIVGICVSCFTLFNIVWPAVKADPNRAVAFAIVGSVLVLHAGLALGFKAYYFDSVIPSKHVNQMPIDTEAELPPTLANTGIERKAEEKREPGTGSQIGSDEKRITTRDVGNVSLLEAVEIPTSETKLTESGNSTESRNETVVRTTESDAATTATETQMPQKKEASRKS